MQAPSSGLVLQRLRHHHTGELRRLIELYEVNFPDSERKPPDALQRMLTEESYHFLLAAAGATAGGMAVVRVLNGGTAALLEYLAVAPSERGRGLGRQIVSAVVKTISVPFLLVEVESDRASNLSGLDSAERTLRTQRKQFYRSMGARELDGLSWIMPQVAATPPPAMELMVFAATGSSVSTEQLRQWLSSIYTEVYHQAPDDPRITMMLAELPDRIAFI